MKSKQTEKEARRLAEHPFVRIQKQISEHKYVPRETMGDAPAQAQHSPLPWTVGNGEHYDGTAIIAGPNDDDLIADCIVYHGAKISRPQANAAFIVRACNNAQRLADALKLAIARMDRLDDSGTGEHSFAYDNAVAKLAQWEGSTEKSPSNME